MGPNGKEEMGDYYQYTNFEASQFGYQQPSFAYPGQPQGNILSPYYPGNYQQPLGGDPRNRFYNSSTEYGLRPRPEKEPYPLAQSLGNALAGPIRQPSFNEQKEITYASTQ